MPARCSAPNRCGHPVTHTARRHRATLHLCASHHLALAESLIRDGWIIAPVKVPVHA